MSDDYLMDIPGRGGAGFPKPEWDLWNGQNRRLSET